MARQGFAAIDECREVLLDFVEKDVAAEECRRTVLRTLFLLLWFPLCYLTVFVTVALFEPNVKFWIIYNPKMAYCSFIAMPLLLLVVLFYAPIQSSTSYTLMVLAVFVIDFAYVESSLCAFFETYCAFMMNLICLMTCTEILAFSFLPLDLTAPTGILIILSSHLINYVAVACALAASVADKAITGGAMGVSAAVMMFKVRSIVNYLALEERI
ncbi:uncharacterized protein LOC100904703 [Galendromus occidentalis]|uniref:Uncharacterized protein LOC100904703 n=1 Tax=Galendromus occidentalis TaxID=34638 RepID=A0AAJ7SEU8_9ACAR|nr:uncharacterized protein LOC100904703 [Galendromus occidentalis]